MEKIEKLHQCADAWNEEHPHICTESVKSSHTSEHFLKTMHKWTSSNITHPATVLVCVQKEVEIFEHATVENVNFIYEFFFGYIQFRRDEKRRDLDGTKLHKRILHRSLNGTTIFA